MGIKTGAGGMNLLERDVQNEDSALARKSSRYASAKSGGAGIGGLLGALALTVITGGAASPLLLAAASGAGALLGSKVGGATSGVSQEDLLSGKFRKKTRGNITSQIASQEFSNVGKAALSSFMGAGQMQKLGAGFKAGSAGGAGFLGGLKGGAEGYLGLAPKAQTKGMVGDILGGAAPSAGGGAGGFDITDIVAGIDKGGLPEGLSGNVMGGETIPSSLLDMGAFGINLPGLDDPGDWEMSEDGREWSPSLGKYKDEMGAKIYTNPNMVRDYR